MDRMRRDRISQWAFDTRPILGRFHLWLEDVDEEWVYRDPTHSWISGDPTIGHSFVGEALEKSFVMAAAVTALGTRLFGRCGEGKGKSKAEVNRIKKDADAASAYALSEALWYLSRRLPENHALMVSMGEGLMAKAGETPEQGSNPLLGFGRVYARPQVALTLDHYVRRLLNEKGYRWENFWEDTRRAGLTVWGAAIDTLENTSRFAQGAATGPMTVLHLYDQPLTVAKPYEGYMGTLVLPRAVHETAAERSLLLTYRTPRKLVLEAIKLTYPGIEPANVHVWTLTGAAREARLGSLWAEWRELGAHLIEDGWTLPTGGQAFTSSGTYAPTYRVGPYTDAQGRPNLIICDGYAASAESIQAASLDPIVGVRTSMSVFSSTFKTGWERERDVMRLDPEAPDFRARLSAVLGFEADERLAKGYQNDMRNARAANIPLRDTTVTIDDFFPLKDWNVLAVVGHMLPDPYNGTDGIEEVSPGVYRVVSSASTRRGILRVTLKLRLVETLEASRLVFSPLLDRFYAGEDFRSRPVKISDSGRIRNELQTLASEALDYIENDQICVVFDRVDEAVLSHDKQEIIRNVLTWYKEHHPIWFRWLSMC
jgi:hypothetical protein